MTPHSRMKLTPGEATIAPLIEGVARVRKRIGNEVHEAMVDARNTGGGTSLSCLPHRNFPEAEERRTARIIVNEWTVWEVPMDDFLEPEWEDVPPPRPVTREELMGMTGARTGMPGLGEMLERVTPENIRPEWGSETE